MPELIPALKQDEILKMVASAAQRISLEYHDKEPVLIGVLKGSFVFLSDLVRHLSIPVKIDFIAVSSYGSSASSSGEIRLTKHHDIEIKDRDILIVEDIIDTGLTISFIINYLQSFRPKSIKICTLIDKHERRKVNINIDFKCHVVKNGFLVGYGLDFAKKFRELPDIYKLNFNQRSIS
ncbi:MAG: hypoxanthine phosphoribosyltransferase [Deltaproteobacteria bacterium]|nr:hypoxanthine phosphoribosyltransferase [Deltaproteobacteria bacterium]